MTQSNSRCWSHTSRPLTRIAMASKSSSIVRAAYMSGVTAEIGVPKLPAARHPTPLASQALVCRGFHPRDPRALPRRSATDARVGDLLGRAPEGYDTTCRRRNGRAGSAGRLRRAVAPAAERAAGQACPTEEIPTRHACPRVRPRSRRWCWWRARRWLRGRAAGGADSRAGRRRGGWPARAGPGGGWRRGRGGCRNRRGRRVRR